MTEMSWTRFLLRQNVFGEYVNLKLLGVCALRKRIMIGPRSQPEISCLRFWGWVLDMRLKLIKWMEKLTLAGQWQRQA